MIRSGLCSGHDSSKGFLGTRKKHVADKCLQSRRKHYDACAVQGRAFVLTVDKSSRSTRIPAMEIPPRVNQLVYKDQ